MALGRILFCAMKTPGSYIILVGIFYQLLTQTFSFSRNIYLTIDNMIITIHLIMMLLPFIVHILNCYFEFINPSWLRNRKGQPCQFFFKRYRKQLYRRKIKPGSFSQEKPTAWKYRWINSPNNKQTTRQLGRSFQKPLWTATREIPVQHLKTMEKPNWLFRRRPQGKQQLTYWLFRGRPQGKRQLIYWIFRGRLQGKQ